MAKFETISQSLFDSKSKEAIDKTPVRKEFGLKNIEVIDDRHLAIDGRKVGMNNQAFKGICKAVGLPVGFDKTFTNAFGDKARQQLVNRLKVAAQAKGNTTVSLVLNPDTRGIIAVQKNPEDIVSNQTFLDTSKSIIDKYNLSVNNFSVGSDGNVAINASSPHNAWGIQGLKDEDFFGGISFTNSPHSGFQVSPYLHRLVCANGMIGTAFEDSLSLGKMDAFGMEDFWRRLNILADNGFRPQKFEEQVRLAINTRASLAELEDANDTLKAFSDADSKELEAWIPLQSTRSRFHGAGIDTVIFSHNQKKGARTGTSVWDLVNGITHFATHDNAFKIDDFDRRKLQMEASRLLTKQFDMANLVASPF